MIQDANNTTVDDDVQLSSNLSITLTDNMETVGVGLVPTERARALVPAPFRLPDDAQPVTPLVVLANKSAGITVGGTAPAAGAYVLIGLLIASPDGTGEFNTLLLWHYTSHRRLARTLHRFGVSSQLVPELEFTISLDGEGGTASLNLPRPARPALALAGTFGSQDQPVPNGFVANWWARHERGLLKVSTTVPEGLIGEAQLGLRTNGDSELGRLIGGGTLGFAVLQRYNTFPYARTELSIVAHGKETAHI